MVVGNISKHLTLVLWSYGNSEYIYAIVSLFLQLLFYYYNMKLMQLQLVIYLDPPCCWKNLHAFFCGGHISGIVLPY